MHSSLIRLAPWFRFGFIFALLFSLLPSLPRTSFAAAPPSDGTLPERLLGRSLSAPGGYLTAPATGDAEAIARAYIAQERRRFGLTEDDLNEMVLKDRYTTAHNGLTHLYFRQRLHGIEVFNADININVAADGRILNMGNAFVSDLRGAVNTQTPTIDAIQAVNHAAKQLRVTITAAVTPITAASGNDQTQLLSDGGISLDVIPVRLIYTPMAPGNVRLSWDLTLRLKNNQDWWSLRLDASNGTLLSSVNYFSNSSSMVEGSAAAFELVTDPSRATSTIAPAPSAGVVDGSNYRVYAFPNENPYDGGRTLLENPADSIASPYGWHDTDGISGAEYTITRGNNTHTYQDQDADNQAEGDEPDGGAELSFDFPIDLTQAPSTYVDATTTQLFYATNYLHDVLYRNGFDEAAGNFQATNYSGAGAGNDYVLAEAQDGAGLVNANFSTPPDGSLPRMQMYIGGIHAPDFTINSPAALAGTYTVNSADFGATNFAVTGDVVLANDGVSPTADACQSLSGIAGKIVLIDRGTCTFSSKAINAQDAGAVGVLLANNIANVAPPSLGGSSSATIPIISITKETGDAIKAALDSSTVNITMVRSSNRSDGALDNGVIAHEYAHGLSSRLTGGPSNSGCLANNEQAGEGWSDFVSLVLTAKAGDTATDERTIGVWLMNQDAGGIGIRNLPYTTDMTVNTYTYDDIKNTAGGISAPHDLGEIWASTLWDVYWRLVERDGFDADLLNGHGGNRLALQLVIDGLKLQPCDPTFVEARDAILSADVAMGAQNQCLLWEGFARRGLGYSADGGSSNSHLDGREAFDLPPSCTLSLAQETLDVCIPASSQVAVRVGESFAGPVTLGVTGAPANVLLGFSQNPVNTNTTSNLQLATNGAVPGLSTLVVTGVGASETYTSGLQLYLADAPPTAPSLTLPVNHATDQADTPLFTWDAVDQGTSYRFELAEEASFAVPLHDEIVRSTSFAPQDELQAGHTYFWRVTPLNGCGSGSTSITASFTVRDSARILLVDDTVESTTSQAHYVTALNDLGEPYDIWHGTTANDEPSLAKLNNYDSVIWFGGYDLYGTPSEAAQTRLSSWLPSGRCFILSSEEFYARSGPSITSFMSDYLGVDSANDDSGHTTVTGESGTFLAALGTMSLSYAGNNYSDHLAPNSKGTLVLSGNGSSGSGAAIARDGGTYRSLYMGFPAEALSDSNLKSVLGTTLNWCDSAVAAVSDVVLEQSVTPETGSLLPGQPITYTLTYRNYGPGNVTNARLNVNLPAQLVDVTSSSTGPALTAVSGLNTTWDVADIAKGVVGTLTIHAKLDPEISVVASLNLTASIEHMGTDRDNSDQAVASTLSMRLPSIALSSSSFTLREDAAPQLIVVRQSEANPYAPTKVDYSLSGSTATLDSDFTLTPTTLTIPANATEASFIFTPLLDELEETSEMAQIALMMPRGASLSSPASLSVTITNVQNEVNEVNEGFTRYLPLVWR